MKIKNNLKKIAALSLTFIMLVTGMFCVRNVKRAKAYDIADNFVLTNDMVNMFIGRTTTIFYEQPALFFVEKQLVDLNPTTIEILRGFISDFNILVQYSGDTYYWLGSEVINGGEEPIYYDFSDPEEYTWLVEGLLYSETYFYGMGIWYLDSAFYELMISLQNDFRNAYTSYSTVYPRISLLLRDPIQWGYGAIVDLMYDSYNDIFYYQGEVLEWLD